METSYYNEIIKYICNNFDIDVIDISPYSQSNIGFYQLSEDNVLNVMDKVYEHTR
jgi:hypothetical protein